MLLRKGIAIWLGVSKLAMICVIYVRQLNV